MPGSGVAGLELAERIVSAARSMHATDQRSTARQACCVVEWMEDTAVWEHEDIDGRDAPPARSSRLFCIAKISDSEAVFIPLRQRLTLPPAYDDEAGEEPAPIAAVRAAVAVTPGTISLMAARLMKHTYLPHPDWIIGPSHKGTEAHQSGTFSISPLEIELPRCVTKTYRYLSTPVPWEGGSPCIDTELYCDCLDWRMHEDYIDATECQQDAIEESLKTMAELVKAIVPGLQL